MKRIRSFIGIIAAVMLIAGALPAFPAPSWGQVNAPKKENCLWWGEAYLTSIYVYGLSSKDRPDPASVESENPAVAEIDYERMSEAVSDSDFDRFEIGLIIRGKGKTFVNYRIGEKSYKTKIVVKGSISAPEGAKYVCPVKSLSISNVAGGTELAGWFQKSGFASGLACEYADNAVLKVQGKHGWKVNFVGLSEDYGDFCRNRHYGVKPANSLTLELGELEPAAEGGSRSLSISFVKDSGKKAKQASLFLNL